MKTVIVTAALTGVLTTRKQCAAIPYTAAEIAEEARRSVEAGASIVHIHARQDDGKPAYDVESYRRIDEAVRAACPQAIVNYSTGAINIDRETRVAHIRALRPEMAALNMGSMNYAIYSEKHKKFYQDHVFSNPFGDILFYLEAMREAGTLPEMECFDCGHINNAQPVLNVLADGQVLADAQCARGEQDGLPDVAPRAEAAANCYSLVMGVLGGIPATTRNLVHQVGSLPAGAIWQCIGVGMVQWELLPVALSLGGNVRVGLEDNLYLTPDRMAGSNGDLVAKAARMIDDAGARPASCEETRARLGLTRVHS